MKSSKPKPTTSRALSPKEVEEIRSIQVTIRTRHKQLAEVAVRLVEQQEKQTAIVRALTVDEQRLADRIREMGVAHGIEGGKWDFDVDADVLAFRRTE